MIAHRFPCIHLWIALFVLLGSSLAQSSYLGFDRNDYPGDENLPILRRTFSYAGYWLNNPPGAKANTWAGKRHALGSAGFGFLVLIPAHAVCRPTCRSEEHTSEL